MIVLYILADFLMFILSLFFLLTVILIKKHKGITVTLFCMALFVFVLLILATV